MKNYLVFLAVLSISTLNFQRVLANNIYIAFNENIDVITVKACEEPPLLIVENDIPPSPGSNYVWVDGNWKWHDHWTWAKGRWLLKPRSDALWIPGFWDKRHSHWIWIEGHWMESSLAQ